MVPRRSALAALGSALGAAATARSAATQQHPAPLPRLGVIAPQLGAATIALIAALGEHGHVDGRTLRMEQRFSLRFDELPRAAAELVALRVDVIAAIGAVAARPAMQATTDIPIVFAIAIDPVAGRLVGDARRPGGNVTGATNFDPGQARNQIRILKDALPHVTRLAILADAGTPGVLAELNRVAAEAEGIQPHILALRGPVPDFGAAFAAVREGRAGAVLGLEEPAIIAHAATITELATAAGLPTMLARDWADRGPMLAYGTSLVAAGRAAAGMVDRVLKGTRPADMPVEVVRRPELVVNLRVARAIGATIPPAVLARAAQVIE